jgi:hypothetical protein
MFQGRVIGYWLQKNGVSVIPNLRWGDERTHSFAFDGIAQGGTIAVGTHGCIKRREERGIFMSGFGVMLERARPETIVVYGRLPDGFLAVASQMNARCKAFRQRISSDPQ